MYCSECGHQASDKFCSKCGAALAAGEQVVVGDFAWRESCDFERVAQVPDVRLRVDRSRAEASKRISSSRLLQLVDAAAAPLTAGLSSIALAKIAQPFSARLGLKTEKQRRQFVALPTGVVLANLAVSLASVEHTVEGVTSGDHNCEVTLTLPADLRAMESRLSVRVERAEGGAWITAQAFIAGQWYDWGKCQSCFDRLFSDLRAA